MRVLVSVANGVRALVLLFKSLPVENYLWRGLFNKKIENLEEIFNFNI